MKLKKFLIVLMIFELLLGLSACGPKDDGQDPVVNDGTNTVETEGEDNGDADNDELSESDPWLQSYAVVLGEYRKLISAKTDFAALEEAGISQLNAMAYGENPTINIGYAFVDLNSDGEKELLIGACSRDADPVIFDMYALVNGNETHIFSSAERDRYFLVSALEDNSAFLIDRVSADSAFKSEWQSMSWAEDRLNVSQAIKHDTEAKKPWMMGYENNGKIEYKEAVEAKLAQEIMKANEENRVRPNFIPFGE